MDNASTSVQASHRIFPDKPDKNYAERVRYWKAQGLTPEEAEREAANPTRRRRRILYAVKNSSANSTKPTTTLEQSSNQEPGIVLQPGNPSGTWNRPATWNLKQSYNLETCQETVNWNSAPALISSQSLNLTTIEKMPKWVYPASNTEPAKNLETWNRETSQEPGTILQPGHAECGIDLAKAPYWITSLVCAAYLIHSMTEALGGGAWAFCIAVAFDITPILLIGAKVRDRSTQQLAMIGAVLIFLTGLSLYLAPHAQNLLNELTIHKDRSAKYTLESKEHANSLALLDGVKAEYDKALTEYDTAYAKHGNSDWRTASARKTMVQSLDVWKSLSIKVDTGKKPEAPTLTESLRGSIQELIKRIGLFASAFLLMFVMRRLA